MVLVKGILRVPEALSYTQKNWIFEAEFARPVQILEILMSFFSIPR